MYLRLVVSFPGSATATKSQSVQHSAFSCSIHHSAFSSQLDVYVKEQGRAATDTETAAEACKAVPQSGRPGPAVPASVPLQRVWRRLHMPSWHWTTDSSPTKDKSSCSYVGPPKCHQSDMVKCSYNEHNAHQPSSNTQLCS